MVAAFVRRSQCVDPNASATSCRAQDELAFEAARLQPTMCIDHLIERDAFGHVRLDLPVPEQLEKLREVLFEPIAATRSHCIDRIEMGPLAPGDPAPQIQ